MKSIYFKTVPNGRVLVAPDIAYKKGNLVLSEKIAEQGRWDHRKFKFAKSEEIKGHPEPLWNKKRQRLAVC